MNCINILKSDWETGLQVLNGQGYYALLLRSLKEYYADCFDVSDKNIGVDLLQYSLSKSITVDNLGELFVSAFLTSKRFKLNNDVVKLPIFNTCAYLSIAHITPNVLSFEYPFEGHIPIEIVNFSSVAHKYPNSVYKISMSVNTAKLFYEILDEVGNNIVELELRGNYMTDVVKLNFEKLDKITSLNLRGVPLDKNYYHSFPKNLEKLFLNKQNNVSTDILASIIQQCPLLTYIKFSGDFFGWKEIEPTLEKSLKDNGFTTSDGFDFIKQ